MKPAPFKEYYVEKDIRKHNLTNEAEDAYQQPSDRVWQPVDAVISVSPNPASDICNMRVAASLTESQAVQYQFFNAVGALVLSGELGQGVVEQQISLAGMPSGVYVYKLTQSGQALGQGKLVVTNR